MKDSNPTSPTTDLEVWAEAEKDRLDEFVNWWRLGRPRTDFPLSMSDGEWDEQYRAWAGG